MAKLFFYYSTMNAGKSALLLQAANNYEELERNVWVGKPAIDTREKSSEVVSRTGLRHTAILFQPEGDLYQAIQDYQEVLLLHRESPLAAVLIDEAQFLTEKQVWQLSDVVDGMDIPVLCYGLRTDAFGHLFPGSSTLLAAADTLSEVRTVCWFCKRKAIMALRVDETGNPIRSGSSIAIGGNDNYRPCCRKHWRQFTKD